MDQDRDRAPDELEDAGEHFNPYRHRRRRRALAAIAVGALGAGVVWVVLEAVDSARNPCQRVRNYVCAAEPGSPMCKSYDDLLVDSMRDPSPAVRGEIRHQCLTRIKRLKKDEGIDVP
jgi:hypothetical protein